MPIVSIDPADWGTSNTIQLDSDAPGNREAIIEMDEWAAENGFARINEQWLRRIQRGGRQLYRGVCYRLTEEEQQSSSVACQMSAEALRDLPETTRQIDRDR
jgi:hypothetical protein